MAAKLIRTEGTLQDLTKGTIFLTLYADDFVSFNLTEGQRNYQNVNERYHRLMVINL